MRLGDGGFSLSLAHHLIRWPSAVSGMGSCQLGRLLHDAPHGKMRLKVVPVILCGPSATQADGKLL